MPYIYILTSLKDHKLYIGSTTNLERRLDEHFHGKVLSTKYRRPLKLYAYRIFNSIKDAALWEKKYKRSHGQLLRDVNNGKLYRSVA